MDAKERLFQELETLCKGAELDFERISGELSEFIGRDEIIDYHIAQAPLPDFPDTVLDIMVLSGKCLYDYDLRQKGALLHAQPLSRIVEVAERFIEGDFLSLHFKIGELGAGLILQGKLSESGNMRRFSRAVINRILESSG